MTGILTRAVEPLGPVILEDLDVSFARQTGAAFRAAFRQNPVPSLLRTEERAREQFGDASATAMFSNPLTALPASISPGFRRFLDRTQREIAELVGLEPPERTVERDGDRLPLSPMLDPEQASSRHAELGLTFDRPVRERVVELMAEARREELRLAAIQARGPSGVFPTAASFTAALTASLIDPINVASAFAPVVGPTRFAAAVARSGATQARLGRGAIEGAAGAAIVEPLVLANALDEQADYGFADSVLNVVFGAAIGGGLHVVGGLGVDRARRRLGLPTLAERVGRGRVDDISDQVARMRPEHREAASNLAANQVAADRPVDVSPVLRRDPAGRRAENPNDLVSLRRVEVPEDFEPAAGTLQTVSDIRKGVPRDRDALTLTHFLVNRGGLNPGELEADLAQMGITARTRPGLINKQLPNARAGKRGGLRIDDAALRAQEAGFFPRQNLEEGDRIDINTFLDALDEDFNGLSPRTINEDPDLRARRENAEATIRAIEDLDGEPTRMSDEELAFAIERRLPEIDERQAEIDALAARETADDLDAYLARQTGPEADRTADFGAAADAANVVARDPDVAALVEFAEAEFGRLAEFDPALRARFDAEAAQFDAQARDFNDGMRALAGCQARGG